MNWYGLRKKINGKKEVILVLKDSRPIPREYFYHHDVIYREDPDDDVVELKLTVKRVIK